MTIFTKSGASVSSDRQLAFNRITNGGLVDLGSGDYRLIMAVSGLNLSLMTDNEQATILNLYQQFLNQMTANFQIMVRLRRLDARDYLTKLTTYHQKQTNFDHLDDYLNLIADLIDQRRVMTRQFYLIVGGQFKSQSTPLGAIAGQLQLQAQIAGRAIKAIGLQSRVLGRNQALNLFRQVYNPQLYQTWHQPTDRPAEKLASDWSYISYQKLIEASDHLQINDHYCRVLTIKGYPLLANPDWLAPILMAKENIDISYHFQPLATHQALEQLNHKITQLQSQKQSYLAAGSLVGPQISQPLESALDLRDRLNQGQDRLFEVAISLNLVAATKAELDNLTYRIRADLAGRLFTTRIARWQQLEGFQSVAPRCQNQLTNSRHLDSSSARFSLPFINTELIHPEGILYGINQTNNSLVLIDRFRLTNANSITLAQSGAGKSYAAKLEIARSLLLGWRVAVIDPEGEYRSLVNSLSGAVIDFTNDNQLNLLDLMIGASDRSLAIANLIDLLDLLVEGLEPDQINQLETALNRLADQKPASPVMADVIDLIDRSVGAQLIGKLSRLTVGGLGRIFNQPTTVNLEQSLVCFNLAQVAESTKLTLILLIVYYLNDQIGHQPRKRLLVIDEAWYLMTTKISRQALSNLCRRARKHYLGLALISQQSSDFLADRLGQTLVAQAALKILLRQDSTSLPALRRQFNLSGYEQNFLLTAGAGQALVIADNQRLVVEFTASNSQHRLITTKPQELYQ